LKLSWVVIIIYRQRRKTRGVTVRFYGCLRALSLNNLKASKFVSFTRTRHSIIYFSLCFALFLTACSGLAGEPPIVATIPPRTERIELPSEKPDLLQGAQIFAENCTRCHGETGEGDGQIVLSGQIAEPPPDFTNPATAQEQTLNEWFGVITNGRLDKLMPPWGDSLNEQERWAVAFYTYTMGYQLNQIASGQVVWEANCVECHGTTGAGDGSRASELDISLPDFTQPTTLVGRTDRSLFDITTEGKGEVMPAFVDKLDESQRWQVISYVRTLSLVNAQVIGQIVPSPVATPEVEIAAAHAVPGIISGRVNNGTEGGAIISELSVTLHIVDSQFNQETQSTTVGSDGTFTFTDIPIQSEFAYLVTTSYQDHTFGSTMVRGDTSKSVLELPITVYDMTDDSSVITVSDIAIQMSSVADILQITQIMNFRNTSDRFYSQNNPVDDARFGSVTIPLPPGAQVQGTANELQRYIRSEDGSALIDTRPVYPGEDHIVHLTYTLPFDGSADIEMPLNYSFDGSIQILLESDRLSITSPQLTSLSPQTMGETTFQSYGANLSLPAGSVLGYSVSQSASSTTEGVFSNNLLAYAFIGIGSLAILGAAVLYFYERRFSQSKTTDQQVIDVIIEQIAELDDLHQKKQINPNAYQEQRKRLKNRLAKLMEKK
jgi:mono/diheme cytochrome c family protein